MVALGCVWPLPLMKGSLSSKSLCWAGPCSLEYLGTVFSWKRTNSPSIHTLQHFARQQPNLCSHDTCSQRWTVFCGGFAHLTVVLGWEGEVKIGRGRVLGCVLGQSHGTEPFQLLPTVNSFGEFGVFNFLILATSPLQGCVLTFFLLLSIHLLLGNNYSCR